MSGLNFEIKRFAFHKELIVFPAVINVSKEKLRCSPCTGNVVKVIPSLGTIRDSSPFSVHTYKKFPSTIVCNVLYMVMSV